MGQNTAPSIATLNSPPQRLTRLGWGGVSSCPVGFKFGAIMLIVAPVKVKATPANPTAGSALCQKQTERGKRIKPRPARREFVRFHFRFHRVALESGRHGDKFIPRSPTSYGVNPEKTWGESLILMALRSCPKVASRSSPTYRRSIQGAIL